jgi:hypothetical protein
MIQSISNGQNRVLPYILSCLEAVSLGYTVHHNREQKDYRDFRFMLTLKNECSFVNELVADVIKSVLVLKWTTD